jgi:hypothetical protein
LKRKCTEIKKTEKMHNTLRDRRKNVPNFRRRKEKCTERKKTLKMHGTVED